MSRVACASMLRVLGKHVWIDVCLQSVYRSSERTVQCNAVKFAECRSSNDSSDDAGYQIHAHIQIPATEIPRHREAMYTEDL